MIDAVLKVINYLIDLLKIRKSNRRIFFEDHIESLFSEMSLIHQDYLKECRELILQLSKYKNDILSADILELIIKKEKTALEPLRTKVYV
jgi:hypothetical protein